MTKSITIQNGILVDPNHALNGQIVHVSVVEDKVVYIGTEPPKTEIILDAQKGFISAGWCDAFAILPDPGAEWKEHYNSFTEATALAGFTQAAVLPGCDPLPDKATSIRAFMSKKQQGVTELLPLGAASEQLAGKEMAEVFDMLDAGAIAQTDGMIAHGSDAFRAKLMEYAHSLNIPYLIHPYNPKWVQGGQIHEGAISVNLGLKGIPTIAETSALLADIELAKWLKVPLRVLGISSKESLEIINNARKEGVEILAAVPIMNLIYDESDIGDFDERFKVLPPLRTAEDKYALLQGVLNGDIQAIVSNHTPEDIETQKVEFDYAQIGAATLPGFIERILAQFDDSQLPAIIHALAYGNRTFLGLQAESLQVGHTANLTVISRNIRANNKLNGSIAYNKLPEVPHPNGGLMAVINGNNWFIND